MGVKQQQRRDGDKRMLLLLLAPLALVSAAPGSSKCTWGPSYWCANLPQASECSAVKHCIKALWEKETVPQDDDEVCKICKEFVCSYLPGSIGDKCEELVD